MIASLMIAIIALPRAQRPLPARYGTGTVLYLEKCGGRVADDLRPAAVLYGR